VLNRSMKDFLERLSSEETGREEAASALTAASAAALVVFALRKALRTLEDGDVRALAERGDAARQRLEEVLEAHAMDTRSAESDKPWADAGEPRGSDGNRETRRVAQNLLDTAEKSVEVLDIAVKVFALPRAKSSVELTSLATGVALGVGAVQGAVHTVQTYLPSLEDNGFRVEYKARASGLLQRARRAEADFLQAMATAASG
jgi:formiminotetrahydrofolate cyclodeaminase